MSQPTVRQMLDLRRTLLQKVAFVPSQPASGGAPMPGGAPPGAPPGDPSAMGGAPPMDPSMAGGAPPGGMPPDPSMAGGAPPPMDPSGGMPPDPSAMIAPDGTSPVPPGGAAGGGAAGKGAGKASQEDILMIRQGQTQCLSELRLLRDLILDMMQQMNLKINPDTLRSSVTSADSIVSQQDPSQAGMMM